VVEVRPESVTLTTELPGRINAFETSEVRPQVNGLIRARLFEEGDQVRAGQPLYRIDPAPYEAQVASARAALRRAQAATGSTAALAQRYGQLVGINAISRQEAENARTTADQARADVAAQQAALRSAQVDLGRTTIRAPISGRIGRSLFTVGALANAAQTQALATIQRIDPVFVDIQEASADVLRIRQQLLAGELSRGGQAARVRLRLEDGSLYPIEGRLKFADVSVDPNTGSQSIRAVFPNPNGLLLPGMFARAELVEGTEPDALLVPVRAVSRNEKGSPTVLVVGRDGKLVQRVLKASRTVGQNWIVTDGLKAGERVVMDGAQMLRPGAQVKAVPFREGAQPQGQPSQGPAPQGQAPAKSQGQ
jgi:membrane fusion protein (multidrug efflux system)